MDEDLEGDAGVDLVSHFDDLKELVAAHVLVLLLRVDDVDERAALLECHLVLWVVLSELLCPWEVLDLKLNVWIVSDI